MKQTRTRDNGGQGGSQDMFNSILFHIVSSEVQEHLLSPSTKTSGQAGLIATAPSLLRGWPVALALLTSRVKCGHDTFQVPGNHAGEGATRGRSDTQDVRVLQAIG